MSGEVQGGDWEGDCVDGWGCSSLVACVRRWFEVDVIMASMKRRLPGWTSISRRVDLVLSSSLVGLKQRA